MNKNLLLGGVIGVIMLSGVGFASKPLIQGISTVEPTITEAPTILPTEIPTEIPAPTIQIWPTIIPVQPTITPVKVTEEPKETKTCINGECATHPYNGAKTININSNNNTNNPLPN